MITNLYITGHTYYLPVDISPHQDPPPTPTQDHSPGTGLLYRILPPKLMNQEDTGDLTSILANRLIETLKRNWTV